MDGKTMWQAISTAARDRKDSDRVTSEMRAITS